MTDESVPNTLDDWYTAAQAAQILSKKSKKKVKPDYLRSLARLGKVRTKKIGERTTLYLKVDVDNYQVEERGKKVARAQKARSRTHKQEPALV